MNTKSKHLLEDFTREIGAEGKHITLILRSRENAIEDRPNAFCITRGKNGYTRVEQTSYYYRLGIRQTGEYVLSGDLPTPWQKIVDYKEYTDKDIPVIISILRSSGMHKLYKYSDNTWIINE